MRGLKVILTERDSAEAWAKSVLATVATHGEAFTLSRPFTFFDAFVQDPERLARAVKAAVPAENLLVFNVKQGWAPLCRFLEVVNCPSTPFPWAMTTKEMQVVGAVAEIVTWTWAVLPLLPFLVVWGFYGCCCRRQSARSGRSGRKE